MPFCAVLALANSAANDNRRAASFMEDLTTFDVYQVPIGESKGASTLVRYLDPGIAPRRRRVYGRDSQVNMPVNCRSLRIAKNDNGKTPTLQILPITDVFIRGQQDEQYCTVCR